MSAPGRPSLNRRVGTSGSFAATMARELTRQPALRDFTERRVDDPAMGLVDAWSEALHVLAFYAERLADEGYLRTARDPRSLTELAHEVGYVPGRGRASATLLAFTLEDAKGAPAEVPIPQGTKVASLPGPGELPQTYETTTALAAKPPWNAMQARTRGPQALKAGATTAYAEGLRGDLRVGDGALLVGREREGAGASQVWAFRLLSSVTPLPGLGVTRLSWSEPLGSPAASSGREGDEKVPDPRDARLFVLRRKAAIFGAAAPDHRLVSDTVGGGRSTRPGATTDAGPAEEIDLRDSAEDPGRFTDTELRRSRRDWPHWTVRSPGQPENTVDLDATYPEAAPNSWAVFTRHGVTVCYRILTAVEESRTDYTLNAKVTRLTMQGPTVSNLFSSYVRQTSSYVGSELIPLAGRPLTLPVQGEVIDLAGAVPTLQAGRAVVVHGPRPVVQVAEGRRDLELQRSRAKPARLHPGDVLEVIGPVAENSDGTVTWTTTDGLVTAPADGLESVVLDEAARAYSEVAYLAGPTPNTDRVERLVLTNPLTGCYDRAAVRVLANVVGASHGETKEQVLGSGDASTAFQRFALAQTPLTYASGGGAVTSTLQVRVDGRLWTEVPRLFGTGPDDEVYTTTADDGRVTVRFGDGRTGARVPTGTNNVTARYRVGTGLAGRLDPDTLTLPMTRPPGVRSVTNPLPTGIAADLEPPSEVRSGTPRTALTLDRVVSLRDVEDFARTVPGIGKAQATWLWDGRQRFVHLTLTAADAQPVDRQALDHLRTALLAAGDARLPLVVDAAEVVHAHVTVAVVVEPVLQSAAVLAAVTASLERALSVQERALGQRLTTGDVILAAHSVAGVVAVNVTLPLADVPSSRARVEGDQARPAQVVALAPGGLTVTEATS